MFRGDRAAQLDGLAREVENQIGRRFRITRRRKQVHMQVSITDMAENYVTAWKFFFEPPPVVGQHLAVSSPGHGVVCVHFESAALADSIVDQFRERMAEPAESLT